MSRMLGVIWAEITTPTGQAGPLSAAYARAMSGVGHAVLGATFCAPLGASGIIMALAVAVIYWTAKERGDLRRGGLMWDGIEDALCVSLGAWYGVIWWPAAVLVAAAIILASAAARKRRGPWGKWLCGYRDDTRILLRWGRAVLGQPRICRSHYTGRGLDARSASSMTSSWWIIPAPKLTQRRDRSRRHAV